jgi:glycosyltransferase involved in cell wall biosynthesis
MMENKVAIIGVYPPPIGGISIHIKRLCDYLDSVGISYTIYDNTQGKKDRPYVYTGPIERWCIGYFFRAKESVIHCHFMRWQVRFLLSLLKLRGKRIIFTFHSYRQEESLGFLKRMMIRATGRLGDLFICGTEKIAEDVVASGIPREKTVVIGGYIPPMSKNDPPLPQVVEEFIQGATPLIVSNGVIGNFFQGEDLYGADLCVELVRELAHEYPSLKFVFCITHTVDLAYRQELQRRIAEYKIEKHFLFVEESMEFYPLVKRSDPLIRATMSDGDAISVREALLFGVPVLGSDSSKRPPQVQLFKNRNLADLVAKTREILGKEKPAPVKSPNFAEDVVKGYRLNEKES